MQKIKILTDSASDITKEQENELDIKVMCFPVTVDGVGYRERVDFTNEEFYEMLDRSASIPTTAQITTFEFVEAYKEFYEAGYTDVIHVTISSTGSNTYNSALMAKESFFEENPDAKEKFRITVIDGLNYTGVYGYPVVQAAIKAQKGTPADEIIAYLNDWVASAEVFFAPYTLEYVKKSGRVSCAAAFVGEVLGLRPIIKIVDGVASTVEKVRGEKNIPAKLIECAVSEMVPQTPYIIIKGSMEEQSAELAAMMTKRLGYPPEAVWQIGAAIACNAGHKLTGIIIKGKNRR